MGHKDKKKKKSKDKKRKRRDSISSSTSSSSSSNSDNESIRTRKHEKKHKKSHKDSKRRKSQHLNEKQVNMEQAAVTMKYILMNYPNLVDDLMGLFHSLDHGEAVLLSGVKDDQLRNSLIILFGHLSLNECDSDGQSGFMLHSKADKLQDTMKELIKLILESIKAGESDQVVVATVANTKEEESTVDDHIEDGDIGPTMPSMPLQKQSLEIGPTIPTSTITAATIATTTAVAATTTITVDRSGPAIGPSLPGAVRSLHAIQAEERMTEMLEKEKAREWRRIRGELNPEDYEINKRESWMTDIPVGGSIGSSDLSVLLPTENKTKFNKRSKAAQLGPVDHTSWTESPAERLRKQKAKAEEEFLGYSTMPEIRKPTTSVSGGVDPSILPGMRNAQVTNELNGFFEAYNAKYRNKSLMQQHQEGLNQPEDGSEIEEESSKKKKSKKKENKKDKKKGKKKERKEQPSSTAAPNFTWDRDRDLSGGKKYGADKIKEYVRQSHDISSRFTSGSNRFL